MNTEDSLVAKLDFKGSEAFSWTKGNLTYFIWGQDEIYCNIIGGCTLEEAQKIAKDVIKK